MGAADQLLRWDENLCLVNLCMKTEFDDLFSDARVDRSFSSLQALCGSKNLPLLNYSNPFESVEICGILKRYIKQKRLNCTITLAPTPGLAVPLVPIEFKSVAASSLFKATTELKEDYSIVLEPLNDTYPFGLPDYHSVIDQGRVLGDLFLSFDHSGRPNYYIDMNTLILLNLSENIPGCRLSIEGCEFVNALSEKVSSNYMSLSGQKEFHRIGFPLYHANYQQRVYSFFGFVSIGVATQSQNPHKFDFEYFPINYFEIRKLAMNGRLGPNEQARFFVSALHKRPLEERLNVKMNYINEIDVPLSVNYSYVIDKHAFLIAQKLSITECLKRKMEIHKQFNEANAFANHLHECRNCHKCVEWAAQAEGSGKFASKGFKRAAFEKSIHRAIEASSQKDQFHTSIYPRKPIDISRYFPLYEEKFSKEVIPFGNPFRMVVKRKFEPQDTPLGENDDAHLAKIMNDHMSIACLYNSEKKKAIQSYSAYAADFREDAFRLKLDLKYSNLTRQLGAGCEPQYPSQVYSVEKAVDFLCEVEDSVAFDHDDTHDNSISLSANQIYNIESASLTGISGSVNRDLQYREAWTISGNHPNEESSNGLSSRSFIQNSEAEFDRYITLTSHSDSLLALIGGSMKESDHPSHQGLTSANLRYFIAMQTDHNITF